MTRAAARELVTRFVNDLRAEVPEADGQPGATPQIEGLAAALDLLLAEPMIYVILDLRVAPKEASVSVVDVIADADAATAAVNTLASANRMPNRGYTIHQATLRWGTP